MTYALSLLIIDDNKKKTKHDSNYIMKNLSEINYTKELYKGTFTINLKIFERYQQKYSSLTDEQKVVNTNTVIFMQEAIKSLILSFARIIFNSDKTPNICIELASYISSSSCTGHNRSNDSPTFVLNQLQKIFI